MKTLNISLPDKLYQKVEFFVDREGFANKAEFFRFLIKFFEFSKPTTTDFEAKVNRIEKLLLHEMKVKGYNETDLPSPEDQLKDV
jgi:metal-responsive CopG/Arc/MetJ family transcriptional regulator